MDKVYKVHIDTFTCSCLYETKDIDMALESSNAHGTIRCRGCGHSWTVDVQDKGKVNVVFDKDGANLVVEEKDKFMSAADTMYVVRQDDDKEKMN